MEYKIALLPGDGIGVEVTREAVKVLRLIGEKYDVKFSFEEGLIGGRAIDERGVPLPQETALLYQRSDAVLFGAVGGPRWDTLDYALRPERALIKMRKDLGTFANLRPAKLYSALIEASPLKRSVVEGIDLMVVRELNGDVYYGEPRGIEGEAGEERGYNTMVYTTGEIERIARVAFEVARKRGKKVTSIDKANVLETSELWRRVVTRVGREYLDVELTHMLVDNAAMQLVSNPGQFDVIVTGNMFGDILSDEASMLTGSLGMLPSASIGGRVAIYEPVHGTAPDIAGKNMANPLAAILSAAMMLKYSFNMDQAASQVEEAVIQVLDRGMRTQDIFTEGCQMVGTDEMGTLICQEIKRREP